MNRSLQILWLYRNDFQDDGLTMLCRALEVNTTLTELAIGMNRVFAPGAQALARTLRVNHTLTEVFACRLLTLR